MLYFYTAAGLTLASEFELPGLIPSEPAAEPPQVRILLADVPAALENAIHRGPTWQANESRFLLRVPDVAHFEIVEGREIRVTPIGDCPVAEIAIFVIGTILGILLHQRSQIVLHASAVLVGGKAVLFCGPSAAGKSTMAAALDQRGYPVVSDDVCALSFGGGRPYAHSDGRRLKLWEEATRQLGLPAGEPIRGQLKKYYVEPGATRDKPVEVGAIYELCEARRLGTEGIAPQNIVDAALLVRRNAYRPFLVRRMGQQALYLDAAARLANAAGIFTLTRSLDFAQMDMLIGRLEEHWSALGLLPRAA